MFVDHAKINIKAGKGGKGCESFYQRRPMRFRRRDGGDGGNGGSVLICADPNIHTLLDFRYRQHFKAESGKHGSSNRKRGRDGQDRIIRVPLGTIVRDAQTHYLIRDLNQVDEQVIVAKGGKGGVGNAKRGEVTPGQDGVERDILLELKLIADVGLIGYPNAGKSSLVNSVSGAHSKVASFPFSTVSPVLGVVKDDVSEKRFSVADIPGIIKDAHKGKGLGIEFLRHIERTRLLLFVVDISGPQGRNPVDDYLNLLNEITEYNRLLLKKTRLIVANKMDLINAKKNFRNFKKQIKDDIYPISCITREGIEELMEKLFYLL